MARIVFTDKDEFLDEASRDVGAVERNIIRVVQVVERSNTILTARRVSLRVQYLVGGVLTVFTEDIGEFNRVHRQESDGEARARAALEDKAASLQREIEQKLVSLGFEIRRGLIEV